MRLTKLEQDKDKFDTLKADGFSRNIDGQFKSKSGLCVQNNDKFKDNRETITIQRMKTIDQDSRVNNNISELRESINDIIKSPKKPLTKK